MWEDKDIEKVLVAEEELRARTIELAAQITEDYKNADKPPILVALLLGAVPFLSDLMRYIDLDIQYDFMDVTSYVGSESTGDIKILRDLNRSIVDENILVVEDIVDTGATLKKIVETLYNKGAKDVKIVSLLDKPSRREKNIHADYVGFEVPNEFVVGFGLDYNQHYRGLRYIGALKRSVYEKE